MILLILQISAFFLLIAASISLGWVIFINRALNSQAISRRWQMKVTKYSHSPDWGQVYETGTYQPITGAVVKLYDVESKKMLDYTATDKNGYFGFAVPDGKFYLRVNSFYHSFPSLNLLKKFKPDLKRRREQNEDYFGLFLPEISDKSFANLYFGEVINNSLRSMQRIFASRAELLEKIEAETPILLNIPMDKEKVLTLDGITLESIKKQESAFKNIKIAALIFGIGLTLASLIIKPNYFNLILIELFFAFALYVIFAGAKSNYEGSVRNMEGEGIGGALIRARGHTSHKIRATAISDSAGRFKLSLNPGWYYFEISRENFATETRLINLKFKHKIKLGFRLKRSLP